ncbi:MAG: geranylgeranylglycerol-phosphate geranylgeranyltransferase [Bacteroidia bacterium]|nr:geranylgeranylglycerol-phosphate geranylgeranyltransferase [Bacteroidia bacterium]
MLRLIRIENLLFIALFQYLLRYCIILPVLNSYNIAPVMTDWQFSILVLTTICMAASGNVINDYFDIYIDRTNRPNLVVLDRIMPRKNAILIHVILTLTGIFMGLYIAFATRRATYVWLFLGIPTLLWFYSTRFKRQLLIGNIIVALLTAAMVYVVISVELSFIRQTGMDTTKSVGCIAAWTYTVGYTFFAFLCNLSREIIKDIEDIEGDKEYGCHTIPVILGVEYTKVIVSALHAMSIIMLWGVYYTSPSIQSHPFVELYLSVGLTIPIILNTLLLYKAREKKDFHQCSINSKYIMLIGVLSMLYFWLT